MLILRGLALVGMLVGRLALQPAEASTPSPEPTATVAPFKSLLDTWVTDHHFLLVTYVSEDGYILAEMTTRDTEGGFEKIFQYDASSKKLTLLGGGGGRADAANLEKFGVPSKVAEDLVTALKNQSYTWPTPIPR